MFATAFLILLFFINSNLGLDFAFVSGHSEKEFLLELRNNLTYDSSLSSKLVHWNESTSSCGWTGVECDDKGRVTSLDLSGESISDGINGADSSLFKLTHLQSLSLAQNSFSGIEFPYGFGQLKELRYLNLSNSGFSGQVPLDLSNLSSLVFLDLSLGSLLNSPKLQRLIHNFTRLREIYLDGVNISANGNEWGSAISSSLPNLRVLSMSNSYLTGPFHPSLQQLRFLTDIRLDGNEFSSPFPEFFANFPNLKVLTLTSCTLSGVVPAKLFQIKSLQMVNLEINDELGGSFLDFPVNGSLQELVLGGPRFSGTLPDSIGNLRMLSKLRVIGSNISGPIPSTISNLTQLVVLDLNRNRFSGPVPSFAFLNNLSEIDLSGNRLTGQIPDSLWKGLDNLTSLLLSDNFLQGKIPASLFLLPVLRTLGLSNNSFSGMIEVSMNVLSPIETLDLSVNRLQGSIPRFLFELRNLSSLSLSSNKFSGSLDLADFQKLTHLSSLDLSYNNLSVHVNDDSSSSLPTGLWMLQLASCKLQKLPYLANHSLLAMLDLSDNELSGEIPSWMWEVGNGFLRFLNLSHNEFDHLQEPYNLRKLQYLNLRGNKLGGEIPFPLSSSVIVDFSSNNFSSIPSDIGNSLGSSIKFFSAADNEITGKIPSSFCNAGRFDVLDLSNNALHGGIPSCLLNQTLRVLNLRRNNLGGDIPNTFPVDCSLKTLDLSRNVLRGNLPKSLSSCSELEVLDLTSNAINDTFPCWLTTLSKLRVLVLRSNTFHGSITCIGEANSWHGLQIFDIASNNISGLIPGKMFQNLQALMIDDASTQQLDHLHFKMQTVLGLYYQDSVTVTMKGWTYDLGKIQTIFTSLDFSDNHLQGVIPETVGELKSLYLLNFSRNSLSGHIPPLIGDAKKLQSLDLSFNGLNGEIPTQLADLTFLGVLNLSYNHLVGMIPRGTQLDGFEKSSFVGNNGLCGLPLNITCIDGAPAGTSFVQGEVEKEQEYSDTEIYVSAALGFAVGLGFIGVPLLFCKRWRGYYSKQLSRIILVVLRRQNHGELRNEDW